MATLRILHRPERGERAFLVEEAEQPQGGPVAEALPSRVALDYHALVFMADEADRPVLLGRWKDAGLPELPDDPEWVEAVKQHIERVRKEREQS